ncbi:MAG: DNA translocase FtsK 4TM domain-containing protein [Patescibacteria group bacterium]|nr:DNA translocase FtsK 4TM domain-containing protein [Patescibacteria group bacterium]
MGRRRKTKQPVDATQGQTFLDGVDPGIQKTILAIVFLTAAVVFTFALAGSAGKLGEVLNMLFSKLIGGGRYLLPFVLVVLSMMYFKRFSGKEYLMLWLGLAMVSLSVLGLMHLFTDKSEMRELAARGAGGGYAGYALGYLAYRAVGVYASAFIFAALIVIGILLAFNSYLARLIQDEKTEEGEETDDGVYGKAKVKNEKLKIISKIGQIIGGKLKREEAVEEVQEGDTKDDRWRLNRGNKDQFIGQGGLKKRVINPNWQLPPVDLLEQGSQKPQGGNVKAKSSIIEKTLRNFGIDSEVMDTNVGPTVTQFAVRPADGTRLSKIVALQNDLSMALAAHPLRIEAPIPGKSLVGVEIPNEKSALVRFRSLIDNQQFMASQGLTIVLGEDPAGNYFYADLANMPHLMIAGATGAGKSIGVAGIISSLLFRFTPDELKFILIDPKRVELSIYNDIPHLITPVIVDIDKVVNSLKWVVAEMERRYQILQDAACRDVDSYNDEVDKGGVKVRVNGISGKQEEDQQQREKNQFQEQEDEGRLPYIIVIIDELADIMVSNGKEVETLIVRIAQKARAVGIHLVLSTQRPSVEIITGLIKANIPTRIAYQVASQIDSRTILDRAGAEKLLGKGDMLYLSREAGQPKRIQGAYIQEQEVGKITDFLKQQAVADYDESIVQARGLPGQGGAGIFDSFSPEAGGSGGYEDELFLPAKQVVIENQKASATLLQRKLKVGYARAARIMEMLEEGGIIGPANGAKPRQILTGREQGREVNYEDNQADQSVRDQWN